MTVLIYITQIEKQLPVLSLCESIRLFGTSFLNDVVGEYRDTLLFYLFVHNLKQVVYI